MQSISGWKLKLFYCLNARCTKALFQLSTISFIVKFKNWFLTLADASTVSKSLGFSLARKTLSLFPMCTSRCLRTFSFLLIVTMTNRERSSLLEKEGWTSSSIWFSIRWRDDMMSKKYSYLIWNLSSSSNAVCYNSVSSKLVWFVLLTEFNTQVLEFWDHMQSNCWNSEVCYWWRFSLYSFLLQCFDCVILETRTLLPLTMYSPLDVVFHLYLTYSFKSAVHDYHIRDWRAEKVPCLISFSMIPASGSLLL